MAGERMRSTRGRSLGTFAVALASAALVACGSRASPGAAGSSTAPGVVGSYYVVTVFRPSNGVVDSTDGRIRCGPAGTGADACSANFAWTATATLNARPNAGYGFQGWAGDCQYTGPCVLSTAKSGADKYVVAVFAPAGEVGHGNYTSEKLHGPAYLDTLGNVAGSLRCNDAACHGVNLQGAGIAPNCFTCHAAAGWTGWQTNCSFCHGVRTAAAKAGYAVAQHPEWSAPPDAISQRLSGTAVPARTGAHQAHLLGRSGETVLSPPFRCGVCHAVPTTLAHVGGSTARASVALSGTGQGELPAALGTYDAVAGTCTTYCHRGPSPRWSAASIACGACHGLPPPPPHPPYGPGLAGCARCHPSAVTAEGAIDPAGTHVNGRVELAGGCDGCHGFPPDLGAHRAHDGFTDLLHPSAWGDLRTVAAREGGASATTYGFGCGHCHPLDVAKHMDAAVEVELHDATAPAGSLKRRSSPAASFDRAAKTCSGTYCHSSGQAEPAFVVTPAWTSRTKLGCDGCHANPPRYASGAPGSATANGHVSLATDGWEWGHFGGLAGPWHSSFHGNGTPGRSASPITCQTCHSATTDPSSTGPSGVYWLDTTGAYQLEGGDPRRLGTTWHEGLQCTSCHEAGSAVAPVGAGRVLPAKHVDGARDVVFDPRASLPELAWLPPAPDAPVAPNWISGGDLSLPWPASVARNGVTVSFGLGGASYDAVTKSCASVACHLAEARPTWGQGHGMERCGVCHPL